MHFTSAVTITSLVSTVLAAPSILHVPGPLPEYDANIIAQIDQHFAQPDLAQRDIDNANYANSHNHHGHQRFHQRRSTNAEVEQLTTTSSSVKRGVTVPVVAGSKLLGASTNSPANYYFPDQVSESTPTLSVLQLVGSVVDSVSTGFGLYNGSGNLAITPQNANNLAPITNPVSISRDTGKGGYLNGSKIFLFADSESYLGTTSSSEGQWAGFVSNTAAVDWGFNAAVGLPLVLRDRPGAFWNDQGTMRTFIPFTLGEWAYNDAMNSQGYRYAIWPSSSLIPLTSTTAAVYAPIVFTNSNNGAFTYAGATLISISVPQYGGGRSGPIADRINNKIFPASALEWGCVGGIRSWGSEGVGGDDGWVYLMAADKYGMMLARTEVGNIADASSYEYYLGLSKTWTTNMPAGGSYDTFVNGSFSNADIFYSPRHQTFIMVWEDVYIDNKFLWSYLEADQPLVPAYDGTDFVENILNYNWAPTQTLFQAPTPPTGYAYSGGVQMGYFEGNDITNGGTQMLITWTAPTGQDAASIAGGYALMSATINWE